MNLPKQDRNAPRTTGDIERRYGKKAIKTEKEVKLQAKDLASLYLTVKGLIKRTEEINNQVMELNDKYEELEIRTDTIKMELEEVKKLSHNHENKQVLDKITDKDIESIHNHENKCILDEITEEDIDNWKTKYIVGDIYMTTETENPKNRLGYGEWTNIATQELSEHTCYIWLRTK